MAFLPLLSDPDRFAEQVGGLRLRSYQRAVLQAVVASIRQRLGLSFVVIFPRQSGKNELQAHLENYLLTALSQVDAEIIKVSPTWKPQSLNAMRRLERVLKRNPLLRQSWKKESGYIYRAGCARVIFLSGSPETNIVGATASDLLEVDEAQDIQIDKYDKEIAPMAASGNATRVFWGTAWSAETLLARELRAARRLQEQDGLRRVFILTADQVAAEVPAYGKFVAEQVARLGRDHPFVRSQFFSEEVESRGSLFPTARCALMQGAHPAQTRPLPGAIYAFLIDVGGAAEGPHADLPILDSRGDTPRMDQPAASTRSQTVLTIVQVELASLQAPGLRAPTYQVVSRSAWSGASQPALFSQIQAAALLWQPRLIVVDSTGLGAGLAGFLGRSFPRRVLPFTFTQASKSRLGWGFLAICDAGRYQEYAPPDAAFWQQVRACRFDLLPGPGRVMRWGVRNEGLHDDLLLSAALCAVLDDQPWGISAPATLIPAPDPLRDLTSGW